MRQRPKREIVRDTYSLRNQSGFLLEPYMSLMLSEIAVDEIYLATVTDVRRVARPTGTSAIFAEESSNA